MHTALVVGATGVVGWALMERLAARPGWRPVGLCRRIPPATAPGTFVSLDLFDRQALAKASDRLAETTHLFITLRVPGADPEDEVRRNTEPLQNLMTALEAAGAPLQRVCLVHGTKWYGCHRGAYMTPAREDHPREPFPNFYYAQHDLIAELQQGRDWTWTTLRPHTVWGRSQGTGNSLIMAVAVLASLRKAQGLPLDFPGARGNWTKLSQGTTAELLAEAMEWAATTPACANQDFNITNGDSFRWQHLWPKIAEFFGMDVGEVVPTRLAETMSGDHVAWAEIAARHDLIESDIGRLVNWSYLDGLLQVTWDDLSSTVKARRYGFTPAVDSEDAFLNCLDDLRRARIVPR